MANRQSRDPGQLRRFDETARIGDAPAFAVDTGEAWRTLASVAGQLGGRLGKLADEATAREAADKGLGAGASSGAAYLRMQAAQTAAGEKAGGGRMVNVPGDIRKIVSDAAVRHGVDPNTLLHIAMIESSGNPKAKNPKSSAGGLFQFIDDTAAQYGLKDRFDPAQAADAGARLLRDNTAHLRKALGREPTGGELYLAHQQGAGGAAKILGNPGGDAVATVGGDAVRLNGGRAGMTNGEFAKIWTSKLGGGAAPAGASTVPAVPVLPTQPLALRRDGTIAGDAYDRAASGAYAWRMNAGMESAIAAAGDAHPDDPEALAGALAKVHDDFAKDPNLADPQLGEVFQQRFVERSQAEILQARARATTKMRAEETAATFEGMAAQKLGLERQAVALGANPQGDAIIARELERSTRAIDGAVAAGSLTPAQGVAAKQDFAETAARGRVQGVFEALDSPEKKEQFATGLLDDWTAGKGPLAKMPFDTVKALSTTLFNQARAESNQKTAAQKIEAARTAQLVEDDIASAEATGRGLDPKTSGLTPDAVTRLLGQEKLSAWREARGAAQRTWQATAGMETQTSAEIAARLALIAPRPGAAGYADAAQIFETATKKASALLKARSDDPAAAAEASFPEVKDLAANADPLNPDSMQALVAARLQAQDALGIDELGRAPLTNQEAMSLARAVTTIPDEAGQNAALLELEGQIQAAYGPHTQAVLTQVLQAKGMSQKAASIGAQFIKKLNGGGMAGKALAREAGVVRETDAAEASGSAAPNDAFPMPNGPQQQLLMSNPDTASFFDKKFGPGAAEKILGRMKNGTERKLPDGGTVTTGPSGEGYTPPPGSKPVVRPQPAVARPKPVTYEERRAEHKRVRAALRRDETK